MNWSLLIRNGLIISFLFLVLSPGVSKGITTLLTEGFEEPFSSGAPEGWSVEYTTWLFDWEQYIGDNDTMNPIGAHSGSYNAKLFFGNQFEDHQVWLITPLINFQIDPNLDINNVTATLEFYHLQRPGLAGGQDTLKVYYKKKASGSWVQLASYTSPVEIWTKRKITLPNLTSTYYIGFLGNAKYGYGLCIDDVRVYIDTDGSAEVPKYYAVICGVADYQNYDDEEDLHYADKDARDVCDALIAMGNWDSENITILTNNDATKSAIQTAVADMANKALDIDLCLFYFSGHGTNDGTNSYLAPTDSLTDSYSNDIRDDQLGSWIEALPTDKYVVILDSCFSGGFIKGVKTGSDSVRNKFLAKSKSSITPLNGGFINGFLTGYSGNKTNSKSVVGSDVQSRDLDDNGRGVVITACNEDEESYETDALLNGVFTYYLVDGMAGNADIDDDNSVSAEECYAYVKPRAANYTKDSESFTEGPQNAQIYDAWSGELELGINDPRITKCTVKAGKRPIETAASDSIMVIGELSATTADFSGVTEILITIDSNDMEDPCVLTFPVDANTYKNSKYRYSKTVDGIRKSFSYDTVTHRFKFSAAKINLTGLSSPISITIAIGSYNAAMNAEEAIINGRKPIPISLLMGIRDSIRIDKNTLKQNTTGANKDQFTVKGGFSVYDADVNMVETDVNVILGTQSWMIPANSFVARKAKFTCSKIVTENEDGIAAASFDFSKGAFTISIKNANIDDDINGSTNFGINFADVNLATEVNLP